MVITEQGRDKYLAELDRLKIKLKKLRENKASAYVLTGDTWHDNPYFKMLELDERQIIARFNEIQDLLIKAEVVDVAEHNTDEIAIGSIFKCKFMYDDDDEPEEDVFEMVGYGETALEGGRISCESPVAKNLLGHKLNDVVEFETPTGKASYTIVKFYNDWSEAENDRPKQIADIGTARARR